ncbi:MAG: polysaccharide deacetylase family protein [Bacilli bacterium]|nr:polysaccharide deacetylase family protein [Bacilli bacterium]
MKNFFQSIGIISLMIGSFMLTDKISTTSKLSNELLNEIKSKKDGYKENAIEPLIKDNTIIPGVNGKEVDTEKSYEEMSKIGYFSDKLLVYKTLQVEEKLNKNKDKYIISLNNSKMTISLIFKVDEKDDITNIIKNLNKRKIKGTFFVNSNYLEKHHNQIIKLINEGHIIGNLSNNEDYTDSDFVWMKTIITNIGNQKNNYCYTEKEKKEIIKNCKLHDSYTIKPTIIIKNNHLLNIKKLLRPGFIISLEVNNNLNNEIETILNYIDSKGYTIKSLEEGLKE